MIILLLMLVAAEAGRVFLPELGVIWRITDGVLLNGIMALLVIRSIVGNRLGPWT